MKTCQQVSTGLKSPPSCSIYRLKWLSHQAVIGWMRPRIACAPPLVTLAIVALLPWGWPAFSAAATITWAPEVTQSFYVSAQTIDPFWDVKSESVSDITTVGESFTTGGAVNAATIGGQGLAAAAGNMTTQVLSRSVTYDAHGILLARRFDGPLPPLEVIGSSNATISLPFTVDEPVLAILSYDFNIDDVTGFVIRHDQIALGRLDLPSPLFFRTFGMANASETESFMLSPGVTYYLGASLNATVNASTYPLLRPDTSAITHSLNVQLQLVPEPASGMLAACAGLGAAIIIARRCRSNRRKSWIIAADPSTSRPSRIDR